MQYILSLGVLLFIVQDYGGSFLENKCYVLVFYEGKIFYRKFHPYVKYYEILVMYDIVILSFMNHYCAFLSFFAFSYSM